MTHPTFLNMFIFNIVKVVALNRNEYFYIIVFIHLNKVLSINKDKCNSFLLHLR